MTHPAKMPPPAPDGESTGSDDHVREALSELAPRVRRYFFGLCGDWHHADDLAQQALTKAWAKRSSFAGRSSLATWVYTIARNHWRDQLRRKPRPEVAMTESIQHISTSPGPAGQAARAEFRRALASAMDALPADQREALALRESDGLSFPEIARLLSLPVGTVKSRVRYALLKLADALEPFGQELDP